MSYLRLTAILLLIPFSSPAQKKLTLEDASYLNRAVFPATLKNFEWRGDSDHFVYAEDDYLLLGTAEGVTTDTLRPLEAINKALESAGREKLRRLPSLKWTGFNRCWFTIKNIVYTFDLETGQLSEVNRYPEEAENTDTEPKTLSIAYTIENDLYLAVGGETVRITDNTDPLIVSGQTVSRNEFGISKGTFWSPDGQYLAYYQKDESRVGDYPLVNIEKPVAELESIKYPMAGTANEAVRLFIFDTGTRNSTLVNTGEGIDQYITNITWDPEGRYIYAALLNRDQNNLRLNKYDARSGELVKALFEETDNEYVEPEFPLYFIEGRNDRFIWMSERDGFQHMYLYDTEGNLVRQLTSGEWVVTWIVGSSSDLRQVYFTSTMSGPLNRDLCSVDLKTGRIKQYPLKQGKHDLTIHPGGKYLVDHYSDTSTVGVYSIIDEKGRLVRVLKEVSDPLKDYDLPDMKIFTIQNEEGTGLYCRMITPPGFDPGNKYPVIVYVYGGPHSQLVTNEWLGGSRLFLYYLAQEGYIVFTLDNRGSPNRGLEFEQAIFRNCGKFEMEDQMAGVEHLMSLPYVDKDRIGVHGWSYGGFMTISLMLRHPGVFKAGVCGGPVTDWKYYEIMYGERYMDTPESNPEGYRESSLLNYAKDLDGKLLMIHGTFDPVVVWQNSLVLLQKFIEEGKQVDYFVYPGHGHGVGGHDRLHLNAKMAEYFRENL